MEGQKTPSFILFENLKKKMVKDEAILFIIFKV